MKTTSINYTLWAMVFGGFALLTAHAASPHTAAASPAQATVKEAKAEHAGRPWFGAVLENIEGPAKAKHQAMPEVRIAKVEKNSPADTAGLRAGDILWMYGKERLKSAAQFTRDLLKESPGTTVPVEIYRHGQRERLNVTLGVQPAAAVKTGATAHGTKVVAGKGAARATLPLKQIPG